MLFYVRRHTGADGSFEWYVLNGHTRRRASKFFPTRAAAAAEREKLQARLDLAKAKVLRGAPKGAGPITRPTNNAPAAGAESCGASYSQNRTSRPVIGCYVGNPTEVGAGREGRGTLGFRFSETPQKKAPPKRG
jgi:hypothetical protein